MPTGRSSSFFANSIHWSTRPASKKVAPYMLVSARRRATYLRRAPDSPGVSKLRRDPRRRRVFWTAVDGGSAGGWRQRADAGTERDARREERAETRGGTARPSSPGDRRRLADAAGRRLKHGHLAHRRLGEEGRSLVVLAHLEGRHRDLHAVVLGDDQALQRVHIAG
eukprot:4905773-Prymnesium_polylepis.1